MYHIGTCSFTEKGLSGTFYPKGIKPAERISFYATHFNCVEIDSSYYALPSTRNSVLFAQRTPDDFTFNFKAFGLMTKHRVAVKQLGRALAMSLPVGFKEQYVERPPEHLLHQAFTMFYEALYPLKMSNKLGMILFQYPPYFTNTPENKDYILQCQEWMRDYSLAIEFRHNSWTKEDIRADTMQFLRDHGLTYVCVDEPQFESGSTVPPFAAATSTISYIRFHGRNTKNWFRRGINVEQRYDYYYSREELMEWVPEIKDLARETDQVYVMFNNCMNTYPVQNAREIADMLGVLQDKQPVEIISQPELGF